MRALGLLFFLLLLPFGAEAQPCSSFRTCEEAIESLRNGNQRIDGDRDGIPCERLCSGGGGGPGSSGGGSVAYPRRAPPGLLQPLSATPPDHPLQPGRLNPASLWSCYPLEMETLSG